MRAKKRKRTDPRVTSSYYSSTCNNNGMFPMVVSNGPHDWVRTKAGRHNHFFPKEVKIGTSVYHLAARFEIPHSETDERVRWGGNASVRLYRIYGGEGTGDDALRLPHYLVLKAVSSFKNFKAEIENIGHVHAKWLEMLPRKHGNRELPIIPALSASSVEFEDDCPQWLFAMEYFPMDIFMITGSKGLSSHLTISAWLSIVESACQNLITLHLMKMIHGDIKPENIMLKRPYVDSRKDSYLKIERMKSVFIDLEYAHSSSGGGIHSGGTVGYKSLSRLKRGNESSAFDDTFAFGVFLYVFMTTLDTPFSPKTGHIYCDYWTEKKNTPDMAMYLKRSNVYIHPNLSSPYIFKGMCVLLNSVFQDNGNFNNKDRNDFEYSVSRLKFCASHLRLEKLVELGKKHSIKGG